MGYSMVGCNPPPAYSSAVLRPRLVSIRGVHRGIICDIGYFLCRVYLHTGLGEYLRTRLGEYLRTRLGEYLRTRLSEYLRTRLSGYLRTGLGEYLRTRLSAYYRNRWLVYLCVRCAVYHRTGTRFVKPRSLMADSSIFVVLITLSLITREPKCRNAHHNAKFGGLFLQIRTEGH
ncbi:hypothetical protein GE061_015249 [Apolygus lucorum]|uniref:Uncharacterized protein n=1 Tax=Apolygus lucorum TaxID=248454 RepID=A0A8S9XKF8_APOLU|nr:hypothetical protein GE061_015249 [Apolygus lucorum]